MYRQWGNTKLSSYAFKKSGLTSVQKYFQNKIISKNTIKFYCKNWIFETSFFFLQILEKFKNISFFPKLFKKNF